MTYEKTQQGNPHRLTIKQHVIPVKTIQRFAQQNGKVEVSIGSSRTLKQFKANNPVFWTSRVWDQRAEHGYMKQIEDKFQALVDQILSHELGEIPEEAMRIVNDFFSLWFHRSRVQRSSDIDTLMIGLTGSTLTRDEQEILESKHIGFVRDGGKLPTRQIVGLQIQGRIMADQRHHAGRRWGVIRSLKGEFLMPDVPAHDLMPISPTALLAANHNSGFITEDNLSQVNLEFLTYSRRYFFGRDLRVSLQGITDAAIQSAAAERNRKVLAGLVI